MTQHTAQVTVDLGAIRSNVARLREIAGAAEVMAVVKGDAYGHGLLPVARAAVQAGATWLGVAQLSEAVALREAGISTPLLGWLNTPHSDLQSAIGHGIDLGISSAAQLDRVVCAAADLGSTARVHLKVDTGMGRSGAFGADWAPLRDAARAAVGDGLVDTVGIFSHLACADIPGHPSIAAQQQVFADRVRDAESAGLPIRLRHLANSAATLTLPETHYDLVRPGLASYGLSPVPELHGPEQWGLRPAMRVHTEVALTKRVPAGQGVSYGHTYVTGHETTLVDVPIGYADGVNRHGSGAAPVQIGGHRHRIAGRVCMDQFVVDVGDQPVETGDEVVLFGDGTRGEPTAQDWAEACDTISYEIVSQISSRLPRRYLDEGQV